MYLKGAVDLQLASTTGRKELLITAVVSLLWGFHLTFCCISVSWSARKKKSTGAGRNAIQLRWQMPPPCMYPPAFQPQGGKFFKGKLFRWVERKWCKVLRGRIENQQTDTFPETHFFMSWSLSLERLVGSGHSKPCALKLLPLDQDTWTTAVMLESSYHNL